MSNAENNENEDFKKYLSKLDEAVALEKSARDVLENILSNEGYLNRFGVRWHTIADLQTGHVFAYDMVRLDRDGAVRSAKVAYLRQCQFLIVLAYEAFESFVEWLFRKLSLGKPGKSDEFRFPSSFYEVTKSYVGLKTIKMRPRPVDFFSLPSLNINPEMNFSDSDLCCWEFIYMIRDLRQVIVHEHGRCDGNPPTHRFAERKDLYKKLGKADVDRWEALKAFYLSFYKRQDGCFYVWMVNDSVGSELNFKYVIDGLKSYAYFMLRTCIEDITNK